MGTVSPVAMRTNTQSDSMQCKSNASDLRINPESIIVAGGSAGGNIVRQITRSWKGTD